MAGIALMSRLSLRWLFLWICVALTGLTPSLGQAQAVQPKPAEIADQAVCRVVESAASLAGVPAALLTRLVWLESRFRSDATSPAGAQGIAQFMPTTAAERGLENPFDPEQAIPEAAELLADLDLRFGNIGLAVAAYNAGPNRVRSWLTGTGRLPPETEAYVQALTGRPAQDWANDHGEIAPAERPIGSRSCIETIASLRTEGAGMPIVTADLAIQGNEITMRAIAAFDQARQRYCRQFSPVWPKATAVTLRRAGAVIDRPLPPLCAIHLSR
jgi:hypothetical protein